MPNKKKSVHNKLNKEEVLDLRRKKCEILGICLIALGIFTGFCIFTSIVGIVGKSWGDFLFGLFGIIAYIMPIIFIITGVASIYSYDKYLNKTKLFAVIIGIVAIFLFIHSIFSGYLDTQNFGKLISSSWQAGINASADAGSVSHIGTGVLGGLVFSAFYYLISVVGCIILASALFLVSIILLTNLSIKEVSEEIKEKIEVTTEKRRAQRKLYIGSVGEENDYKRGGRQLKLPGFNEEASPELAAQPLEADKPPVINTVRRSRPVKPEHKIDIPEEEGELSTAEEEMRYSVGSNKKKYVLPPLNILKTPSSGETETKENTSERARTLLKTLESFGITSQIQNIITGPSITRYELSLAPGVKLSRVQALHDDIALAMAANGIRIAPIPGKSTIGIEVPNSKSTAVLLSEVLQPPEFMLNKSKICVGLGKDATGKVIFTDLHKMPHLLIAGATGSGKSVCMNTIIASILFKATPEEVKMIMIDPKVVELSVYNGIPHLAVPVVTDPTKAAGALNWAKKKMIERYAMFANAGVKDLGGYNAWAIQNDMEMLPQIVIFIDELSDLMMVCGKEVEDSICRLAQMARAAGMYLVLATQRPSVDVITGLIKANIPSRIAFAVSSSHDSRTILDMVGAEKLLGKGDMLFYPIGEPKPIRAQGAFISESEVEDLVGFIKSQNPSYDNEDIAQEINTEMEKSLQATSNGKSEEEENDNDEMFIKAIQTVILNNQSSISFLQRKLKIGFNRACTLIERMEEKGILGKPDPNNKNLRTILMSQERFMLEYGSRLDNDDE